MPPPLIKTDDFDIQLVPSKRRVRITLKVCSKGVFLHIPAKRPMEIVHDLIEEKSDWIKKQLAKQPEPQPERQWQQGETLSLFGQQYELQLTQKNDTPSARLTSDAIILSARLHRISLKSRRQAIVNWYKEQAEIYLTKRTDKLSQQTGLTPKSITIKTYKARWGSCNIRGEIQYNWQIMQAPPSVIDYLIIHELCHLKHHNHGQGFWGLVESHYPEYRREQAWLKQNGHQLQL
jgi:predicted metal-dependent hydrolase